MRYYYFYFQGCTFMFTKQFLHFTHAHTQTMFRRRRRKRKKEDEREKMVKTGQHETKDGEILPPPRGVPTFTLIPRGTLLVNPNTQWGLEFGLNLNGKVENKDMKEEEGVTDGQQTDDEPPTQLPVAPTLSSLPRSRMTHPCKLYQIGNLLEDWYTKKPLPGKIGTTNQTISRNEATPTQT